MIAKEIGIDLFDDTTYEASRLMYWPSTCIDGEFVFKEIKGDLLNPDDVLNKYKDWTDSRQWPVSSRQKIITKQDVKKQADPLEKGGLVGEFCRAYSIEDVVENFLSNVYDKVKWMADMITFQPLPVQEYLFMMTNLLILITQQIQLMTSWLTFLIW